MRKDCILSQLNEEQKDQLYDWLCESTYAEVQKRLAQPAPEGFGIQVHRNTLWRFYSGCSRQLRNQALVELRAAPEDPADHAELLIAAKSALAFSTFQRAQSPSRADAINELSRVLYRHEMLAARQSYLALAAQHVAIARERAEVERQRLKLEEVKFRFDASKEAALRAFEIKEVLKEPDITIEDKVWAVSDIVFGPSPDRVRYHSQSPNPLPDNSGPSDPTTKP
jgi:hypothetical protein